MFNTQQSIYSLLLDALQTIQALLHIVSWILMVYVHQPCCVELNQGNVPVSYMYTRCEYSDSQKILHDGTKIYSISHTRLMY